MTSNSKDQREVAAKLHEKARYMRGRFLNLVAVIERDIAIILTEYFCTEDENKRELFFEKVTEKLSLQKKKAVLIDIVKSDYPLFWNENKEILNQIEKIQTFRNKLAHSVIDVSDEALQRPTNEGVGFVQWNKGKPISEIEFENMEVCANMITSTLTDIKRQLPFKEK